MNAAPENISVVDIIVPPRPVAELAHRPWNRAMLRFLKLKRRQGKPIRWIAERLGLDLLRVVAMAVNLRLTLHTSYRGRRCKQSPVPDLPPLGPENEIVEGALCRWIAADPSGPWAMCARPALEGYAYCPHHKAQAYTARRPRFRLRTNVSPMLWPMAGGTGRHKAPTTRPSASCGEG